MFEHIFREAERSSYLTADTNEIITTLEKKERIVRCKDCKHFESAFPFGFECYHIHPSGVTVEPDGFCAWGDHKEVE